MKSLVVILFFIGMSMVVIGYNYSIINKNPKTITITKTLLDQQFSPMNVFKSKQASFNTEFNSLLSEDEEDLPNKINQEREEEEEEKEEKKMKRRRRRRQKEDDEEEEEDDDEKEDE